MDKKVTVQSATSDISKTYLFMNEDHTLGNALRYTLMRNKDVAFAGYTVPHPSEPKMNLRLQTTGKNADEVLREGTQQLDALCSHIDIFYKEALKKYKQENRIP